MSIKKIVLYGAESTGKTTLAQLLATHYQTLWNPEFARGFLEMKDKIYHRFERNIVSEYEDIEPIAIGQITTENALILQANDLLFCDTDLLTVEVYSKHYFGKCPSWLPQEVQQRTYNLHLLLHTDIAWIADAQRDRPQQREEMFELFKEALLKSGKRYVDIKGDYSQRLPLAIKHINDFIKNL